MTGLTIPTALTRSNTTGMTVPTGTTYLGTSPSPPFVNPTSIPNLSFWVDASDAASITQAAGAVSQWNDKSGNGYNLTQPTGANQPITGTRTIGGLNAIDFDGVDDNMIGNAAALNYDGSTVLAVFLSDVTTASLIVLGNNGGGGLRYTFGNQRIDFGNAAITKTPLVSGVNIVQMGAVDQVGTATQYFKWGSDAVISGANIRTGLAPGLRVGSSGNGATSFFDGIIGEIVNYQRFLSNAEINTLGTYLSTKWGATWANI